jgi:hypothetical protein
MLKRSLAILALLLVTSCANMGGGMSCCGNGGCCASGKCNMMDMQKAGMKAPADMKSMQGGCCSCCGGMMGGKGMQCPFPQQPTSDSSKMKM